MKDYMRHTTKTQKYAIEQKRQEVLNQNIQKLSKSPVEKTEKLIETKLNQLSKTPVEEPKVVGTQFNKVESLVDAMMEAPPHRTATVVVATPTKVAPQPKPARKEVPMKKEKAETKLLGKKRGRPLKAGGGYKKARQEYGRAAQSQHPDPDQQKVIENPKPHRPITEHPQTKILHDRSDNVLDNKKEVHA